MCGIVGIAGFMPVNQSIYDALSVLQHRGQDAAGIITIDELNCFRLRKANGMVNDVFEARHMQRLQGNMGIGHVRYPTWCPYARVHCTPRFCRGTSPDAQSRRIRTGTDWFSGSRRIDA